MASNIKSCRRNAQGPSGRQIPSAAATTAETICSNEDLVVEILQRLPAKSVIRFRSVSKTWRSLISSRRFPLLWQQQHRRHPKIAGVFFSGGSVTQIEYIPAIDLDSENKSLALFPDFSTGEGDWDVTIKDSCNGFLVIHCFYVTKPVYDSRSSYHVYNPTTKQFSTLPWPFPHNRNFLYLAFDPLKSPHYKVVLLHGSRDLGSSLYQIHIYSSETNSWWSPFGDTFSELELDLNMHGVYCNGSIHWISFPWKESTLYFDVEKERLCPMPSPPRRDRDTYGHFGESRGHLHFVQYNPSYGYRIDVFEMERDYSNWSLKYRVNLMAMVDFVSEEMIVRDAVSVLSLIEREDDGGGDVFLVLFVGTNLIISYNIKDNTFKKLDDVANRPRSSPNQVSWFEHCCIHPYIETLFPV